jgi:DNA-binding transcriptional MocR family regulator
VTTWLPEISRVERPYYRALADAMARDIAAGRLPPGARLPPQRDLAHALGVTVPTVTRAYALAARRGLVDGTVGRGTFVRPPLSAEALDAPIDLSVNAVPPHAHLGELASRLELPVDAGVRATLLAYPPRAGLERHREAGAAWMGRRGVRVPPDRVLVTGGAQHALVVALAGVTTPGDTLLVEELTYGGLIEAARLLGLRLHAVAMDPHGIQPPALERAARETGARVVVLQPVIHNPTGVTMTAERRRAVASVVAREGLHVIEDDIYGFLAPETPPLVTELAQPWTYLTSLSKSVVAGIRVGYLAVPVSGVSLAERAVWATTVAASPITAELAAGLILDGTADGIVTWKRGELGARQGLARQTLPGLHAGTHPASPHVWWPLPRHWKAGDFIGAARTRGILLGAPEGFLGRPGATPRAVRLCLGPPATRERLTGALEALRDLAESVPSRAPLV